MPTIRLRLADDNPLLIPAHAFRLMETYSPGAPGAIEGATCILLFDLGDANGMRKVVLKSTPGLVIEQVQADPLFYERVVHAHGVGGKEIWFLARHVQAITGRSEPLPEVLAGLQLKADAGDDKASGDVQFLRAITGARTQLDLLISDRVGEHAYPYWLTDDPEAVIEACEPTPVAPAAPAKSTPTPRRRKAA